MTWWWRRDCRWRASWIPATGSAFANGGGAIALYPDFGARVWEAEGCAPLVIVGPALDAVRRRLGERAVALAGSRAARGWPMLGGQR